MPAIQYPFIDIAVHQKVGERFARGEALVLFSADLARVLWANGEGARLFGTGAIYDFLDEGPNRQDVTFRQLETAARQLSAAGARRSFLIRIADGFQRVAVEAGVEMIRTQAGEDAVLFSAPTRTGALDLAARAARMLEGFDDPDTHIAVVGPDGRIIAASPRFAALGMTGQTLGALATLAGADPARLVKRPVPTGRGHLPAAIGKLSDSEGLCLLFVVETILGTLDPQDGFPGSIAPAAAPVALDPVAITPADMTSFDEALAAVATIEEVEETEPAPEPDPAADPAGPPPAEAEAGEDAEPQHTGASDRAAPAEDAPERKPAARTARFVWKIDAEGRFTDVSGEFAEAVGPAAAAIAGELFTTVAARFGLDPEGKIAELLTRRDTWSGKTVLWPVENTATRVPVDLAALPTYTRSRDFDGFRGFGIVRLGDIVEDPAAAAFWAPAEKPAPSPAEDAPVSEPPAPPEPAIEEPAVEEPAVEEPPATPRDMPPAAAEPPALRMVAPADHRSDKVVNLEERRRAGRDGLSPGEEAAFREIGLKLSPLARPETPAETAADNTPPATTAEAAEAPPSDPRASDSRASDTGATEERVAEPAQKAEPEQKAEPLVPARMAAALSPSSVDEIPVALLVHVGDRLLHANPEFLRLTGYETLADLELIGGLDALLRRDDLDGLAEHEGGMLLVRADDHLLPVNARLKSIGWQEGNALLLTLVPAGEPLLVPASALASAPAPAPAPAEHEAESAPAAAVDIAEIRASHALAALQAEIGELRSILETATDGVVIIDQDGDIRSMNRSAMALFNYDREDTETKPFVMLFAHESQRAVADYLAGLAGHGVASVLNDGREVIGREASGGFIPLFMTIGRLSASNGFCAVIRDITQWKRTEEELKNARRAAETANAHKSEFLARVSHEIRTPLNAIIGFSDIMAGERFGPIGHPRYVEYANDIGRSGRHVLDIVNDLLDISKIEAGEMELDFTAVGLNETVAEAVAIVQPQANAQRVIVRTSFSQAVPQVVADLRSIKQIALNLLSNAIRFTPSGGQIVVSTAYEPSGSVVLRIRDTGIGMTRMELEQAMKPFRQVVKGPRHRGDGTGLGLPLTKAMVDANRANFQISSAPNEGTLVEITFPSQRVLAN